MFLGADRGSSPAQSPTGTPRASSTAISAGGAPLAVVSGIVLGCHQLPTHSSTSSSASMGATIL